MSGELEHEMLSGMLDEVLELEEGLSDWEVNYVDELKNYVDGNADITLDLLLTDKQKNKLKEIHAAKVR